MDFIILLFTFLIYTRITNWTVFARYSNRAIITLYPASQADSVDGEDQQTISSFSDIFDKIFENIRRQDQVFRKLKIEVHSSNAKIGSLQSTISLIMGKVRLVEVKIAAMKTERELEETGLTIKHEEA